MEESRVKRIYHIANCETGDGSLIFTPNPYNPDDPNDLWITSGKWYWHNPSLR